MEYGSEHLPIFGEPYILPASGQVETPRRYKVVDGTCYIVTDHQEWPLDEWRKSFVWMARFRWIQ